MLHDTKDRIKVRFKKGGTVVITTDPISEVNHFSAEQVANAIQQKLGGKIEIDHRLSEHTHVHHHEHVLETIPE